jgi:hypothetical protein
MALKVSKVDVWAVEIRDEPGALAQVLETISKAGGDVEGVIARRQADKFQAGVVFLTPVKGKKVEAAARAIGAEPGDNLATLRVEGPNTRGKGARIMRAVADAGINLRGLSVTTSGKSFAAYIGLDSSADADKAAKIIKAAGAAKKPAKKRKLARV